MHRQTEMSVKEPSSDPQQARFTRNPGSAQGHFLGIRGCPFSRSSRVTTCKMLRYQDVSQPGMMKPVRHPSTRETDACYQIQICLGYTVFKIQSSNWSVERPLCYPVRSHKNTRLLFSPKRRRVKGKTVPGQANQTHDNEPSYCQGSL